MREIGSLIVNFKGILELMLQILNLTWKEEQLIETKKYNNRLITNSNMFS
jgi:hypothetical protein